MSPSHSHKRKNPVQRIAGFLLPVALILMTVMGPAPLNARELPATLNVDVMGTGVIVNDNVPMARGTAITSGLVAAVERVIAELVPTDSMVVHFDEINGILYGQQAGFIQGYKVLAETEHEKHYRVMVQAAVDVNKVRQQLTKKEILGTKKAMPSVLLLISEERIEDIQPRYWWNQGAKEPVETITDKTMTGLLSENGFTIVSHTLPSGTNGENPAALSAAGPALDNATALAMGTRYNAEIVIVGKAVAAPGRNSMGADLSFSGVVTARALITATGTEIAAATGNALTINADEVAGGLAAMVSAGTDAGTELAAKVTEAWKKAGPATDRMSIEVRGENSLVKLVRFRRVLNGLTGVSELQTLEMESDRALLSLEYTGHAEDLADTLMHQNFGTFGISITEAFTDRLEIDFTSQDL